MGRDTKKIPFNSIIQIQLSPRNIKHDVVIETIEDIVYLDILKQTDTYSNIDSVYGWYLAFKSTDLENRIIYDV